jgi:hypothetical protein
MNRPTTTAELDRRLRRLCATLDAAPGFEARLEAQLAARLVHARPLPDAATRARACERLLRERRAAEAVLRRRLRTSLLLVAGAALAAVGPAWICGQFLAGVIGALPSDVVPLLAVASGAAFLAWVAAVLARVARGQPVTALLA